MTAIRALSFDLDGTLVDTAGEITAVANRTLADFGVEPWPEATVRRFIGHGARALMLHLLAHTLLRQPELADRLRAEAVLASMDIHHAAMAGRHSQPYPGAIAALQRLQAAGVPIACVTNKEQRFAERVLEGCGLTRYIDVLIAGDTLPQKKPDPAVLRAAAQRLAVPVEALAHVGDSGIDLRCARAAGALAWGVTWGYDGGEPLVDAAPGRLFDRFDELTDAALAAIAPRNAAFPLSASQGVPAWP